MFTLGNVIKGHFQRSPTQSSLHKHLQDGGTPARLDLAAADMNRYHMRSEVTPRGA